MSSKTIYKTKAVTALMLLGLVAAGLPVGILVSKQTLMPSTSVGQPKEYPKIQGMKEHKTAKGDHPTCSTDLEQYLATVDSVSQDCYGNIMHEKFGQLSLDAIYGNVKDVSLKFGRDARKAVYAQVTIDGKLHKLTNKTKTINIASTNCVHFSNKGTSAQCPQSAFVDYTDDNIEILKIGKGIRINIKWEEDDPSSAPIR